MPREEPSRAKDALVQFAIHFVLDTIDRYVASAALVRQTSESVTRPGTNCKTFHNDVHIAKGGEAAKSPNFCRHITHAGGFAA
jgi:hypothetical protein